MNSFEYINNMKVYKLTFTYLDSCEWDSVTKEFTAITLFQLMKAFINECRHVYEYDYIVDNKRIHITTVKDLWNVVKNHIEELIFPIIKTLLHYEKTN